MKLLLKHDELDTNIVVDAPAYVPEYGIGCEVVAEINMDGQLHEVEAVIVQIQTLVMLDRTSGEVSHETIYTLDAEDYPNQPIEVKQDEIKRYWPHTNDFSAAYYENEEQSEADVEDSQDTAANGG